MKTQILIVLLSISSSVLLAQPVSPNSIFGQDDMELKLIQESERNNSDTPTTVSISPLQDQSQAIAVTTSLPSATTAIQFDNLPKIMTEVTSTLDGSFEIKVIGKRQNEELCQQKLQEMKQVVESNLKRSVYRAECSEPEFSRLGTNKSNFSSKAVVTFF